MVKSSEGLAEHQNRHTIFTTSNCDICIQQGLEPSDIIIEALELYSSSVDNIIKTAGRGPPEVEECLYRIRKFSSILISADQNCKQAARLNQNKKQKAGCKNKKKDCKAGGKRNQSRFLVNKAQA